MLAWPEQVKYRGLSEQPSDIQVATKSCNMKHKIEITWINLNHLATLERSVINNWERGLNRFYKALTLPSVVHNI